MNNTPPTIQDVIGEQAYAKLVQAFGGGPIYIPGEPTTAQTAEPKATFAAVWAKDFYSIELAANLRAFADLNIALALDTPNFRPYTDLARIAETLATRAESTFGLAPASTTSKPFATNNPSLLSIQEAIGEQAYAQLVQAFGGGSIYIPRQRAVQDPAHSTHHASAPACDTAQESNPQAPAAQLCHACRCCQAVCRRWQ